MKGICDLIRESCQKAQASSQNVKIKQENLKKLAESFKDIRVNNDVEWRDCAFHYFNKDDEETTLAYIFVIDTFNFCFWPSNVPFEYDTLGTNLKKLAEADPSNFHPKNMMKLTSTDIKKLVFNDIDFPLIEERSRLLQETCQACLECFDGKFTNFVKSAHGSAEKVI